MCLLIPNSALSALARRASDTPDRPSTVSSPSSCFREVTLPTTTGRLTAKTIVYCCIVLTSPDSRLCCPQHWRKGSFGSTISFQGLSTSKVLSPISNLAVDTQNNRASTVPSLPTRTLPLSTPARVSSRWPTLVPTPTARSFSSAPSRLLGLVSFWMLLDEFDDALMVWGRRPVLLDEILMSSVARPDHRRQARRLWQGCRGHERCQEHRGSRLSVWQD